jgi:hypothetical protein
VGDRQSGSQCRAMATIEEEQRLTAALVQRLHHSSADVVRDPKAAKSLAFKAQERHLIQWIDGPQIRIELQAVDDLGRIVQPNVLGPEVAMAVDDMATDDPVVNELAPARDESTLYGVDMSNQTGGKAKLRREQDFTIVSEAFAPSGQMTCRGHEDTLRLPIELREDENELVKLSGLNATGCDRLFQRAAFVQSPHHDQPVDDCAFSADRKTGRIGGERHDREIDVRREPPIQ